MITIGAGSQKYGINAGQTPIPPRPNQNHLQR